MGLPAQEQKQEISSAKKESEVLVYILYTLPKHLRSGIEPKQSSAQNAVKELLGTELAKREGKYPKSIITNICEKILKQVGVNPYSIALLNGIRNQVAKKKGPQSFPFRTPVLKAIDAIITGYPIDIKDGYYLIRESSFFKDFKEEDFKKIDSYFSDWPKAEKPKSNTEFLKTIPQLGQSLHAVIDEVIQKNPDAVKKFIALSVEEQKAHLEAAILGQQSAIHQQAMETVSPQSSQPASPTIRNEMSDEAVKRYIKDTVPLYLNRGSQTAFDFFQEHFVDKGITVYQYWLGDYNNALYGSLRSHCTRNKIDFKALVPPIKKRTNRDIINELSNANIKKRSKRIASDIHTRLSRI